MAPADVSRQATLKELRRMKRLLIFAVVVPPLGFVVAFWVMLQIANWLVGAPSTFDLRQVVMLPMVYVLGVIPALLMAWFDHVLAQRQMPYRIALTASFAYALSYVPLLGAFQLGFMHGPLVALFGLIGAVPAALCSWLASERSQPVGA
jgi:Family of unknown function (DUF5413)